MGLIDAVSAYRINLDRRPDRLAHSLVNEAAQGFPPDFVERFKAHDQPEFGALGCAKSHAGALLGYLQTSDKPWCLVLEDDFDFLLDFAQVDALTSAITGCDAVDAVLFAAHSVITLPYPPPIPGVVRILEAYSTSGYLVRRRYVPALLANMVESLTMLAEYGGISERKHITSRFAIDVGWKRLQRRDGWFMSNPAVGHQRPDFSDIEGKPVDYSHASFYQKG